MMAKEEKKDKIKSNNFVEREFHEGIAGEYDEEGFFNTPNGSFWDPDGVYFNREGYDKHGGYYDEETQEYIPGPGWDEKNNCYLDEFNEFNNYNNYNDYDDEYASDQDYNEDDGYGDVDLNQIIDEENFINAQDIEQVHEDPNKDNININNTGAEKKIGEKEAKKGEESNVKEEPEKKKESEEEGTKKPKTKLAALLDSCEKENKKKKKEKTKNNSSK